MVSILRPFPYGKTLRKCIEKMSPYRRFPEGKRNHCAWEAAVFYIEKKNEKYIEAVSLPEKNIEKLY